MELFLSVFCFMDKLATIQDKRGIFKVNAVNRDNPGCEALQEDFRRQTLQISITSFCSKQQ